MRPRFLRGRASHGAATIMAGTAVGQALALVTAPVLTRLYHPAEFGVFAVVSGAGLALGTAAALRYELAVPLPEDEDDARALVGLGLVAAGASALVLLLVVVAAEPVLGDLLGWDAHSRWLLAVPALAGTVAAFSLLNQWALRQQRYAATARRNVLQSVTTVLVQLGGGLRAGPGGLVVGALAGQFVGAASLLLGSGLGRGLRRSRWRAVASRYRRFPLLLVPAGLLNAGGAVLPLLVVAGTYGATAAGWLGLTQRVLALPVALLGQAVAQVYLSELARSHREGTDRHRHLFRLVSTRLSMAGAALGCALLLLGPAVFLLVFGEPWRTSGLMAQALGVSLALQLVASPLSQTLVVLEHMRTQLLWDAGRLVAVTAAVWVPWLAGFGVVTAVWALSLTSAACYALSWLLSRRALEHSAS